MFWTEHRKPDDRDIGTQSNSVSVGRSFRRHLLPSGFLGHHMKSISHSSNPRTERPTLEKHGFCCNIRNLSTYVVVSSSEPHSSLASTPQRLLLSCLPWLFDDFSTDCGVQPGFTSRREIMRMHRALGCHERSGSWWPCTRPAPNGTNWKLNADRPRPARNAQ
ncbi:hypothetical protein EJ03DRAFT_141506 [Teratosphaeria nubilosa]|uniref:Uncharacterized protein n=1 Tax=Teratosphaeria nubilosa TaxID=161662 RepID=A0A6G1L4S8_9PEZI|nr:hypothetical protein EJ03DRAFT_141506 [Teratosphaeria nubilosa]